MSTQADAVRDASVETPLTVEEMFRGLPAVGHEDPWRGAAREEARAIALRVPPAALDAIRHF